jgi:hypothetical protein
VRAARDHGDMRYRVSGVPVSGGQERRSRDHAFAAVDDPYELFTER